ncbi:hypothetical protein ACFOW1_08700 [Parasediminibacterium paludis]|uniref:DUF106 domain-containing protein n=1 Tax=Parasediminibacterium paludis TaxID=908966 RepID=A0ABV8PYD8_9BACT
MTENRLGLLKLLLEVFKTKFPFPLIGFVFIIIPVVTLIPVRYFLESIKDTCEKYDHTAIAAKGKDLKATVTELQTQYNVTINEAYHPQIITYTYNDGQVKTDKFKTLIDPDKPTFKVGDTLNIRLYKGETIIKNLEPYSFPVFLFYTLPIIFLIIGIPLFLMGLLPVLRKYKAITGITS